jgi:hypothetical protein
MNREPSEPKHIVLASLCIVHPSPLQSNNLTSFCQRTCFREMRAYMYRRAPLRDRATLQTQPLSLAPCVAHVRPSHGPSPRPHRRRLQLGFEALGHACMHADRCVPHMPALASFFSLYRENGAHTGYSFSCLPAHRLMGADGWHVCEDRQRTIGWRCLGHLDTSRRCMLRLHMIGG